jgi:hypothetical protein
LTIATNQQKENLAVAYGTAAAYASLHSADPGTTGTSEISGGSPAYARKALTWTAGSVDGVVTATATFDIPAGTGTTHAGLWPTSTGGTFLDKVAAVYSSQASQGQMTVNFTYTQS